MPRRMRGRATAAARRRRHDESVGAGARDLPRAGDGVAARRSRHEVAQSRADRGKFEAEHYGISFRVTPLTRENYRAILEPLIGRGDFLLNLSVDVSSVALAELCCEKGAIYLDTCIEPWLGGYTDPNVSPSHRSNYGLREAVMGLRDKYPNGAPTVIPTHGANPGLISHWVKQAMLNVARDVKGEVRTPRS